MIVFLKVIMSTARERTQLLLREILLEGFEMGRPLGTRALLTRVQRFIARAWYLRQIKRLVARAKGR
jgi:hypothetical protein